MPFFAYFSSNRGFYRVLIKVVGQNGTEVYFKMEKTEELNNLREVYGVMVGINEGIRLLFDGEFIRGDDTPASLGMENYDQIDAMALQMGG